MCESFGDVIDLLLLFGDHSRFEGLLLVELSESLSGHTCASDCRLALLLLSEDVIDDVVVTVVIVAASLFLVVLVSSMVVLLLAVRSCRASLDKDVCST